MIPSLPHLPARVHFVGIGGIGMSGLARILTTWGYDVSGSDGSHSPMLDELASEGIAVNVGHTMLDAAANADLVVMTAAVNETNPEVAAALTAGKPVIKRAALLGALMNARDGLAVAGSHGKSTTSGMLATALLALGTDPSYAVGATLAATGANAAPGSGHHFVVEADEYDYSFLHLVPLVATITNIEFDHPDIYPDTAAYDASFAQFVAAIRREGALIVPADDPGIRRLLARPDFSPPAHLITFGEAPGADWTLSGGDGAWAVTTPDGHVIALDLAVPGRHNARNATAAMAMMARIGIEPADAARALSTFRGVGRRFESKGEAGGVLVIDDYAHHPTEIRATLRAARERYPDRRIWGVFQPHTYSRLKALMDDFGAAFGDADQIGILDVYASREIDTLGVSADDLRALLPETTLNATSPADAAVKLAALVEPGDVVFTLGAGSITDLGPLLLERLNARQPAAAASRTTDSIVIPGTALKVQKGASLRPWTTWHVGGPAEFLVRAGSPESVAAAARWGIAQQLAVTVFGGGSNLLVGDGGIRGLVILARTPGERADDLVHAEDLGAYVRLTAGANAPLSWTGRYAAERGWSGLDWAVGLPGTVGGATVNNAGAHGAEMKDHLDSVDLLDLETGNELTVGREWLDPSYRHTTIKAEPRPRRWVVLRSRMLLPKGNAVELVRLADDHADFRKRTQPGGATGGSTFANPPGDYAGRLLEAADMKGFRIGGAAFSEKHANWIVNDRNAAASDIRDLIRAARERVRERFGVELRQEVEEVGEP